MMIPDQTTIASLRLRHLHSNLAVDPGVVAVGDHLNTTLVVFQFVQTLKIADGRSFIFAVVPVSRIEPAIVVSSNHVVFCGLEVILPPRVPRLHMEQR